MQHPTFSSSVMTLSMRHRPDNTTQVCIAQMSHSCQSTSVRAESQAPALYSRSDANQVCVEPYSSSRSAAAVWPPFLTSSSLSLAARAVKFSLHEP